MCLPLPRDPVPGLIAGGWNSAPCCPSLGLLCAALRLPKPPGGAGFAAQATELHRLVTASPAATWWLCGFKQGTWNLSWLTELSPHCCEGSVLSTGTRMIIHEGLLTTLYLSLYILVLSSQLNKHLIKHHGPSVK